QACFRDPEGTQGAIGSARAVAYFYMLVVGAVVVKVAGVVKRAAAYSPVLLLLYIHSRGPPYLFF
ncbi:MAG TPA: hypothetical protein VK174_11395, partial [Chitinophagales bacterium]|nr:hypothetical protein [Chitinophagales bacterium]